VIAMTAAEIAAATGGRCQAPRDATVTAPAVVDSRLIETGGVFVALPGEHADGHDFVAAALAGGATLVIAEREVDGPCIVVENGEKALGALAREVLCRLRSTGEITVIGITGSVGKTTTKDLLAQLLEASGPTVAPAASFNNEIGLPLTVLRADERTRYLVLEMGASGPGHLDYLTDIAPPDVAVVLVVGRAHLGGFGGIEAVAAAKAEIVAGLAPGGLAVLNADDARVAAMSVRAPGEVLWFGEGAAAQVRAEDVIVDETGRARFTLRGPGGTAPVTLQLVGEHHILNALAAAAAAIAAGLTVPDVATRLSAARAISPHRMAVTERPDGITVIDDSYNANPDSMRAALKALAVMAGRERRSIAVLGEMLELGEDTRVAHDELGRLAVRLNISVLVVVGDGARAIHDGAAHEGSWGEESILVQDVDAAEEFLDRMIAPGDVVLVKSSHGAGLWRLGDYLTATGGTA
jgi:UDP-N-acetylmuramoyl-tripeptide--D-alanyl-D-alanine ligase